jgi:ActR/RegA family two-component response regulator
MAPAKNVLIVEDERDWSDIYERAVAKRSIHSVRIATNLEEAEMLVAAMAFAVAFVDIGLDAHDDRNVDGLHVLKELAKSGDQTSLIVVTGKGTMKIARDAMKKYNALDVLDKGEVNPVILPKLLDEGLHAHDQAAAREPIRVHDVVRGKLEPWLWDDRILRAINVEGGVQTLYRFLDGLFEPLLPIVGRYKGQQVEIDPSTSVAYSEYWSRSIGKAVLVCFGNEDHVPVNIGERLAGNGVPEVRKVGRIIWDHSLANLRGMVFELSGQTRSSFFG